MLSKLIILFIIFFNYSALCSFSKSSSNNRIIRFIYSNGKLYYISEYQQGSKTLFDKDKLRPQKGEFKILECNRKCIRSHFITADIMFASKEDRNEYLLKSNKLTRRKKPAFYKLGAKFLVWSEDEMNEINQSYFLWIEALKACKERGFNLPTKKELDLLFKNRKTIPKLNLKGEVYWSSTEHRESPSKSNLNQGAAWTRSMDKGSHAHSISKDQTARVRCIKKL